MGVSPLMVGGCVSPHGWWVCLPSWLVGGSPLMVGGCVSFNGWWVGLCLTGYRSLPKYHGDTKQLMIIEYLISIGPKMKYF